MDISYFNWAYERFMSMVSDDIVDPLTTCFACRPFVYLAMSFAVVGVLALIKSMLFNKKYL